MRRADKAEQNTECPTPYNWPSIRSVQKKAFVKLTKRIAASGDNFFFWKSKQSLSWGSKMWLSKSNTSHCHNNNYNIARALVLYKSYWAIMNKIFMYARPCSIKWREQFYFSCKISFEFSARSFCLSFGNVKIIVSNPNPTSCLWLLPGKDVYFNVSILTLFVSVFIEYFYFVWLRCFCERNS